MSLEVMNAVWRYSKSTDRARLVLLAIADHQGEIGAWPAISTLARMVNASERSVQRDIQELVELGELLVEVQNAPTKSQYKSNLYWVILPEAGVTKNDSGVTESASGVTDFASGVTTVGVLNLNRTLNKPLKEIYAQNEFEKFWNLYPRKVGKNAADKALRRVLLETSFDEVMAGLIRMANDPNLPEKQFVPHPATWLNRAGWLDEPYPVRNTKEQLRVNARDKFLGAFPQTQQAIGWSENAAE